MLPLAPQVCCAVARVARKRLALLFPEEPLPIAQVLPHLRRRNGDALLHARHVNTPDRYPVGELDTAAAAPLGSPPIRKGPGTCTPAAPSSTRITHSTISTRTTVSSTRTMVANGSAIGISGRSCCTAHHSTPRMINVMMIATSVPMKPLIAVALLWDRAAAG